MERLESRYMMIRHNYATSYNFEEKHNTFQFWRHVSALTSTIASYEVCYRFKFEIIM